MTWMFYIRDIDNEGARPLRSEAITQWTQIPRKGEVVYIGRPYIVTGIMRDYDARIITVGVRETEWPFLKTLEQSVQNATR